MAKIDIEQIKADREAGTQGPWGYEKNDIFAGSRTVAEVERFPYSNVEAIRKGFRKIEDADTRRIARVPDYEDALIEAIELLRYMRKQMLPRGNQKIENFLERFK